MGVSVCLVSISAVRNKIRILKCQLYTNTSEYLMIINMFQAIAKLGGSVEKMKSYINFLFSNDCTVPEQSVSLLFISCQTYCIHIFSYLRWQDL